MKKYCEECLKPVQECDRLLECNGARTRNYFQKLTEWEMSADFVEEGPY